MNYLLNGKGWLATGLDTAVARYCDYCRNRKSLISIKI